MEREVIGGAGVEIEETHITTVKYYPGRNLTGEQNWVFGSVERDSKEI